MIFFVLLYSIWCIGYSTSLPVIETNLCVNCKFFIKPKFNDMEMDYGRCKLFRITKTNNKAPTEKDYAFCSTSRMFKEMCGKDGKLFQQKFPINN